MAFSPSPFVYWAQTPKAVSLKVDLKNVSNTDVKVTENEINFSTKGTGALGECHYTFNLHLYGKLTTENEVDVRVFENRIEILLTKEESHWWPRLTATPQKPAWLKINFDQWKSEDGAESEEEVRDVMTDYPGMYDKLHKEEMGYRQEDLRKVYLLMYNVFQFVGYTYMLAVMGVRFARFGSASFVDTYAHVGAAMMLLQTLQFLEIVHPLLGFTKGGALVPFMQVGGRAFILFIMLATEPRMQSKPVVFYLFIVWCTIEVVRYPFYISKVYKREFYFLTWMRYTLWIPLYPLGIVCESVIILRNIPFFEESQKFTISLPNEYNFAFHMPTFMRIYLLLLTAPGMYFVMKHMHALRTVKLRQKVVIKKSK